MVVIIPDILIPSLIVTAAFQLTLQFCPEEISSSGKRVKWYHSLSAIGVQSDPLCIHNGTVVTRDCINDKWIPTLAEIPPCNTSVENLDSGTCPPGFKGISKNSSKYCYQIEKKGPWNYPCLLNGGGTVITELKQKEIEDLVESLNKSNYRYFWMPALRDKTFLPFSWLTPGPNWKHTVINDESIPMKPAFFRNCLLLDAYESILVSDMCSNNHPSLCLYKHDFHVPTECPDQYQAFRYVANDGGCFGIVKSEIELTFRQFVSRLCTKPMGNGRSTDLIRFMYSSIAEKNNISDDTWCWFAASHDSLHNFDSGINKSINQTNQMTPFFNAINNNGTIVLMSSVSTLKCMACETNMIISETDLVFEYDDDKKLLYLIVYLPSGLWKYNNNDIGVQCFSDADGFSRIIDVADMPWIDMNNNITSASTSFDNSNVIKHIYIINLVTRSSARYWCEGHTKKLSLITTEKLIVNPQSDKVHVFTLVLELDAHVNDTNVISGLNSTIHTVFKPRKVLIMDILDYKSGTMQVAIHLHVAGNFTTREESVDLPRTLKALKSTVDVEFPKLNYKFINMSSATHCLPAISHDSIELVWELTPIGHIAAPVQFCLQDNGVPVNRQCLGSYLLGSYWGEVEGQCDKNYAPTEITSFLFDFKQGKTNYNEQFLTAGLEFVLEDLNILIPADIYFLSVSLQLILDNGKNNFSSIETGDIQNIAWIMDRMLNIDTLNLRLAQTLNSTNAILDSTNNFIELITAKNITTFHNNTIFNAYQLAIQPQFIVQISYPEANNITGIAVLKLGDFDQFTDMIIQPLYKNTTLSDVLLMKNLEIATWLPNHILKNLRKEMLNSSNIDPMHIVIKIYNNNAVFQELKENKYKVNSRIVEVSLPGYETNFNYPISLIFREIKHKGNSKACGYWDFKAKKGKIPGGWSNRGCFLKATIQNLTVCECYHLTHFAQLLNIRSEMHGGSTVIDEKHEKALNIITLIGSFLSLIGIVGIWVTATVFGIWRKKTGTKVLLQLTIAIALPLVLIIFFNLDSSIITEHKNRYVVPANMNTLCISLGALFHYSVLANFTWMLITAILQFIRYVRVLGIFRPARFMIKLALIGWGFPCVPVIAVLLVDRGNYIPKPSPSRSFCYPNGIYLITGVIIPVCLVLLINIILFLLVIKSISKSSNLQATDKNLVFAQLRLSIFLFFLLGLTWIFGVASFSGQLIWSYLFCLTSTVQGLVLFVYFVICDPHTRNMWIIVMKPQFTRSRPSINTISSG